MADPLVGDGAPPPAGYHSGRIGAFRVGGDALARAARLGDAGAAVIEAATHGTIEAATDRRIYAEE